MSRHTYENFPPTKTRLTFLRGQNIKGCLGWWSRESSSNCKCTHHTCNLGLITFPSSATADGISSFFSSSQSCFPFFSWNEVWTLLEKLNIPVKIYRYIANMKWMVRKNFDQIVRSSIHVAVGHFENVCKIRQQTKPIYVCTAHCKLSWRMGVTASRFALVVRNMAWRSHGESNSDLIDQLKSMQRCDLFCAMLFFTSLFCFAFSSWSVEEQTRRRGSSSCWQEELLQNSRIWGLSAAHRSVTHTCLA